MHRTTSYPNPGDGPALLWQSSLHGKVQRPLLSTLLSLRAVSSILQLLLSLHRPPPGTVNQSISKLLLYFYRFYDFIIHSAMPLNPVCLFRVLHPSPTRGSWFVKYRSMNLSLPRNGHTLISLISLPTELLLKKNTLYRDLFLNLHQT